MAAAITSRNANKLSGICAINGGKTMIFSSSSKDQLGFENILSWFQQLSGRFAA